MFMGHFLQWNEDESDTGLNGNDITRKLKSVLYAVTKIDEINLFRFIHYGR